MSTVVRVRRHLPALLSALLVAAWLAVGHAAYAQRPQSSTASPPSAEETEGDRLIASGRYQDALAILEPVVRKYRRAGDRLGAARVRLRTSAAHRALLQFEVALRQAQEAHDLAGADPALLKSALTQLGRVAADRGDFTRADTWFRQALSLAERAGDVAAEAGALRWLGRVSEARGLQRESVEYYQRAASAADRAGDLTTRITSRTGGSVPLLGLSRYDDALAMAQDAADLAQQATVPALRAEALFTLAQAHAHVWNLDRASSTWPLVIDAYRAAGSRQGIALSMKQSVDTSFARGDFDRAVADGETSVTLLAPAGLQHMVPETVARLALSETRRGRYEAARAWSARARAELAGAPEARHIFVLNDLGLVALELGDFDQALADFTRVVDVAQRIGNVEYVWRGEWGIGRVLAARGNVADAAASLERAIAIVERLRQTIPEAGLRATFMANRVAPYETLVEATMAASNAPDDEPAGAALHVAERARSRALADLLAEARGRPSDPRLQAIRSDEIAFGQRFSANGRRVSSATDDAARTAALEELRTLEHEYENLVLKIRRENAGYAALAHPRVLTAGEISKMLAPDEALLEFLITEKRGFAWIVRHDRVRAYEVPGQNALAPQVLLLQALLAANDAPGISRLGSRLYGQVIAPAGPALRGVRRLIVVPDGALQRVPFALLRAEDQWLVERHILTMAPSATILEYLRRSPVSRAARPMLALAAPDAAPGHARVLDIGTQELGTLTYASQEIDAAARIVRTAPGDRRIGPAATEQVLKSADAGAYRILHLAAHAVVDEIVPRRSAVLLTPEGADDGLLQVNEIANLSLAADLVVLAACRSHVGRVLRGEGLLSLSRAFMHAGARAIIATSWKVADRETAWLMRELYRGLGDGLAPDEALQRAQQRAIADGGRNAAPASWGAFLVIGEARAPILGAGDVPPATWPRAAIPVGVVLGLGLIALWMRRRAQRAPASAQTEASGR
jgi:CHAT domain-containing protein